MLIPCVEEVEFDDTEEMARRVPATKRWRSPQIVNEDGEGNKDEGNEDEEGTILDPFKAAHY
jgi:hypothetical protein